MSRNTRSRSRSNSVTAAGPSKHYSSKVLSSTTADNSVSSHFEALFQRRDKYGRTLLHCLTSSFNNNNNNCKDRNVHYEQTQKLGQTDLILSHILSKSSSSSIPQDISGASSQQLMRQYLSCPDFESGYTPLHRAVYSRDLRMILLIMWYASNLESMDKNQFAKHANTDQNRYKLELTHNNYMNLLEFGGCSNSNYKNTFLYHLTQQCKDKEGFTPLQLLGHLYSSDIIDTLQYVRNQSAPFIKYFSLKRSRSDSVASASYVHNYNTDGEDDSDDDSQHPHGDVFSFAQLQSEEYDHALPKNTRNLPSPRKCLTYGTEVLTFGSQDHPALGQFRSSSKTIDKNIFSSQARGTGVIMGRIETFATFNRDNRANDSSEEGKHNGEKYFEELEEKYDHDTNDIGNAVDISVASHHSLVVTTSGNVFSFGLGKSGKLGLGTEHTALKPQRVEGALSNRFVTTVAAAENHSLCTTLEGDVFAWGSNRFGQLGVVTSSTLSNKKTVGGSSRTIFLSPTRVDDLRKKHIINLAAGDRHSVALSKEGEVFCFGDNKFGQCGSQSITNVHRVRKVDSLWSSNPRKIVIAVAASDKSTLVLTKSRKKYGQATNAVYSWGNGMYSPTKVNFSSQNHDVKKKSTVSWERHVSTKISTGIVNPIKIACAKHHNVAVSSDGKVYTWGLSSDAMAREESSDFSGSSSYKWNSPQLVKGMLPENGGGKVIATSASEHHTAVVTSAGHLYTWGASNYGDRTLGHDGVKYQPCPRRVPGVFRAVGVATAREHTALLLGVNFPHFPTVETEKVDSSKRMDSVVPSLHRICQKATATYVDIFNVIPILLVAERQLSSELVEYCLQFIHHNLDTVLSVAKKRHLETLLREGLVYFDRDLIKEEMDFDCTVFNPAKNTGTSGRAGVSTSKLTSPIKSQYPLERNAVVPAVIFEGDKDEVSAAAKNNCRKAHPSLRAVKLANEKCNFSNRSDIVVRYDSLTKAMKSIRKKLNLITTLEDQWKRRYGTVDHEECDNIFSQEQLEKLARRPSLEADLSLLQPVFDEVKSKMVHFNFFKESVSESIQDNIPLISDANLIEEKKGIEIFREHENIEDNNVDSVQFFQCEICNVTCPDENSLSLHLNGRRHRNRGRRLEETEEKETARKLMEHKMALKCDGIALGRTESAYRCLKNKPKSSALPKFTLSPPSHNSKEKKIWPGTKNIDWTKSIPRKSNPSPVQKLTSKPINCKFQQIVEEEERQKKSANKDHGFNYSNKNSLNASSPQNADSNGTSIVQRDIQCFNGKVGKSQTISPLLSPSSKGTVSISLGSLLDLSERKKTQKIAPKKTLLSPKHTWNITSPVTPQSNSLINGRIICNLSTSKEANREVGGGCESYSGAKISLFEIQQKEEELKAKADTQTGVDNYGKWFVHRRERAASIGEIQRLEEEDRQTALFIEEQKNIEEIIKRDTRKLEEKKKKTKSKKEQQQKRRKQQQLKKQRTIADDEKQPNQLNECCKGKGKCRRNKGRKVVSKGKTVSTQKDLNASAGEFKPVLPLDSAPVIRSR